MFRLGIRQPARQNVTGTIVMMDDDANSTATESTHLKKNHTGIILFPQPHDDPNDPLNWPTLRKDLCFLIIGFQTFIGGGQTPILAAGFSSLLKEFHKSLSTISYLVGAFMLSLGFGSVFASPAAALYGKRLVYLIGICLFLVGAIVCASARNFGALMAGRVLTGFGASPTESLASASLSELYFQHERAYRTGLYTLLLLGGKNILPLLSSLIFQHLDRHWLYWILAMFLGLNLVLTFLFVPETFWDRSPTPNKRSLKESEAAKHVAGYVPPESRPHAYAYPSNTAHSNNSLRDSLTSSSLSDHTESRGSRRQSDHGTAPMGITDPTSHGEKDNHSSASEPRSFKSRLSLFSGRHTEDRWWMVLPRPFYLYAYPSVLFGSIAYSLAVVWLIVISETLTDIFETEAYGATSQTIGLYYISPFVGGILGSLSAGIIGDRLTRWVVRANHGIYEPEFRLFMLIPSSIFTCLGLMGYGWSAYETDPWIAPVIFFGCLSFGSSMASTTAITYVVDCYKMHAAEALVSFNFAKNVIGFIFSLFNNLAYDSLQGKNLFVIYGCVQLIVSLSGILMYVYGKSCRAWTDEKELLRRLYRTRPHR